METTHKDVSYFKSYVLGASGRREPGVGRAGIENPHSATHAPVRSGAGAGDRQPLELVINEMESTGNNGQAAQAQVE